MDLPVEVDEALSTVGNLIQYGTILVLIVFSGVFSGLNLGLMSLTLNDLTVRRATTNSPALDPRSALTALRRTDRDLQQHRQGSQVCAPYLSHPKARQPAAMYHLARQRVGQRLAVDPNGGNDRRCRHPPYAHTVANESPIARLTRADHID